MIFSKFNGYSPDGSRLLFKGGKGGSNSAAKAEKERQAKIAAATNTINGIFGNANRQSLYDEQYQTVADLNQTELLRQQEEAERSNRFGLARTGLLGGSVDIDSNANLQRKAAEGQLQALADAEAAAANLRAQDEAQKQSLISLAQTGIDTGTAATSASNALDSVYQNALGARAGSTLGDVFSGITGAYMNSQLKNALVGTNPYARDTTLSSINSTRNTNAGSYS